MCTPILAGGLAGYGAQQLTDKNKKSNQTVTNNYYGKDDQTVETGDTDTPAKNKDTLKLGNNK